MSNLIQYVVLRKDLNWAIGALVAQGCHASIAAISEGLKEEDKFTLEYLNNFKNMRKVVLKVDNEIDLLNLDMTLKENNIKHHLWIEQPDNIVSCLATYPRNKEQLRNYFRKFELFN